jgi:UDP:flavonoid glycosyltransferase YjiC (YdhE family)
MARILIATIPVAGHLMPLVPLCRALVSAGHEVAWYTVSLYEPRVEAAGARYFGYESARDYDDTRVDEEFPERAKLKELPRLIFGPRCGAGRQRRRRVRCVAIEQGRVETPAVADDADEGAC